MHLALPEPPLTGEGWTLRPWAVADAESLVAGWTDAEVKRWNPVPDDPSLMRAESWINGWHQRRDAGRALDLAIDRAAPAVGRTSPDVQDLNVAGGLGVVGEIGLSGFDVRRRAALVGYWLLPGARGQGIAAATLDRLSSWALDTLDLGVLVARCATPNLASQRVAERAGFRHGRHDGRGYELWVRRND